MKLLEILRKTNPSYFRYRYKKLQAKYFRHRDRHLFTHACFNHPLINIPKRVIENEGPVDVFNDALMERVCRLYQSFSHTYETAGDIWQEIEARRRPYTDALLRDDYAEVRSFFLEILKGDLLEGMAHANGIVIDAGRNPYTADYFTLRLADTLLSLAEAMGTYPVHSFAQMDLQRYIDHLNPNLEKLVADIEQEIGFSLDMPQVGNPPIVRIGDHRLNPDPVQHAYTAHRIQQLLGNKANPTILEIGGGYGMTALMSHRAGLRNYTIIDLPYVSSFQLGYLGAVIGSDKIQVYGEKGEGLRREQYDIALGPPVAISAIPDRSIDLVVNVDSIPEMPVDVGADYLKEIKRVCRGQFLSMNQEARKQHINQVQTIVPELVKTVGGFKRTHRFRHWMEQGYVEEVYDLTSTD
ncbi:putative sugar O-methyltransferase [Aestuariispira insulae]|uniref:Putative sugar O-methyltransferase n=1 Tax=Aestuariispira insulae TaxID=1461337 RepID=A0A3D9HMU6_9PROT|nr:putative sugar O-methyltransferase [Aestuariispira insulae]RED50814.1 putative sugar O-methyltransferase [Aestuariispira insulae]